MEFCYSPQRSSSSRVSYFFDLDKNKILIEYATGEELSKRINGEYETIFTTSEIQNFELDLTNISEEIGKLPVQFITKAHMKDEHNICLELIKFYGPEEQDDFSITFPDFNKIDCSCYDHEISNKNTKFTDFEKLVFLWKNQLSEILSQTNNLYFYLDKEYEIVNSNTPPFGSPITIRSFKTSILQNTVLYIESLANFICSIVVSINNKMQGAPVTSEALTAEEIDKLIENNNKYIRLEDKLIYSIERYNFLYGTHLSINKGDNRWNQFKKLKMKRDSLTHVKIKDHSKHTLPSLDNMLSSVKIIDSELLTFIEIICWFNETLDSLLKQFRFHFSSGISLSNIIIIRQIIELASKINNQKAETLLKKYKIEIL